MEDSRGYLEYGRHRVTKGKAMHMVRWLFVAISASLCGCANFETIQAFAKDGSSVAAAAQKDVDIFSSSCAELRTEERVLAYARGASSPGSQSTTCANVIAAGRVVAESLSVQLLIKYHDALNALAGDENWTIAKQIEALGSEVRKVQVDGKALVTSADVERYQAAFIAIADLVTSALREREAKRLLQQDLNWKEVLKPLRFWYGGADGKSVSFYSNACRIVRTDWELVQSELMDYTRCQRMIVRGVPACEPLTAGIRIASNDAKLRSVAACAPGPGNQLPPAAAARVELIDSWLAAHEELRLKAFESNPQSLLERLGILRMQVDAIKKAFE